MNFRIARVLAVSAAVALAIPTATRADEIRQITSGQIELDGGFASHGTFTFSGEGFTLSGGLSGGVTPEQGLSPFAPGQLVSRRYDWTGADIRGGVGTPGVVDGTTYASLFYEGNIAPVGESIVFPAAGPDGSLLTISTSFMMDPASFIQGFTIPSSTPNAVPAFAFGLRGGGTITSTYTTNSGVFDHVTTLMTFSPAPAVTPEPASVLLMLTGVAGVAASRRRRWACLRPARRP
jgi:hypothetical protein